MIGDLSTEVFTAVSNSIGKPVGGILQSSGRTCLKKTVYSVRPPSTHLDTDRILRISRCLRKLRTAQEKDRKRSHDRRAFTKVSGILVRVATLKWQWTGHVLTETVQDKQPCAGLES